jgi:FtsP/CotA-like multicopper oxidase with cupredoxin domain
VRHDDNSCARHLPFRQYRSKKSKQLHVFGRNCVSGARPGAGGLWRGGSEVDETIPEPEVLSSKGGVLNVTLRQSPSSVVVAGHRFTSNVFNDSYIPPVLKLRRGDRMALTLQNRIGKADNQIDAPMETNLHYHGMSITPIAPGDDVFLHVGSGADYLYEWDVPANHPQGAHWYHPHAHGLVETQILSGMSGMLIVDGLLDHYPAFQQPRERHYLMKDIVLPGDDPVARRPRRSTAGSAERSGCGLARCRSGT